MAFNTNPIPNRVFKGIFEIIGFIREFLESEDLSTIPDRIIVQGVDVTSDEQGNNFSLYSYNNDPDSFPVVIDVLTKTNEVVQGVLRTEAMELATKKENCRCFAFNMFIDLFYDVKRIEEFIKLVKKENGDTYKETVIVAHLKNRGLRISILKEELMCY